MRRQKCRSLIWRFPSPLSQISLTRWLTIVTMLPATCPGVAAVGVAGVLRASAVDAAAGPASIRRRSQARPTSAANAAALNATVLPSCCHVIGRLRPAIVRRVSASRMGSWRSSGTPHLPQKRSSIGFACWQAGQIRSTIVILLKALRATSQTLLEATRFSIAYLEPLGALKLGRAAEYAILNHS